MLVLIFLVATSDTNIGLEAGTTPDGPTLTSSMPPYLDPGPNRSDSSDAVTITNRQRDAIFTESREASGIWVADILMHIPQYRKRRRMTKFGTARSSLIGGGQLKNRRNVRMNTEEKKNDKRRCLTEKS